MARLFALGVLVLAELASGAVDAQITAGPRFQDRSSMADPSVLGWVSTSGVSDFSELRSCDYPATLSRSGSFAQCCGTSGPCNFFTACSANSVLAAAATVSCDDTLCNTGVIVPSAGAQSGVSFLGCWASSFGTSAFTMVQDIGSASIGTPTPTAPQTDSSSASGSGSGVSSTGSSSGATAASSAPRSTPTSSNIATGAPQPLPAAFGLAAGFLALM